MLYRLTIWTTLLLLTACASTSSGPAVCDGTVQSRAALADALLTDGGPQSRRAGLLVLDQVAAGCG